mmetsp:Transcript_10258/g.62742  ORF Transcript_10258/g.62742 Transcript_10258/m.62742 type:complete len:149 (+) Transcript_10258:8574-9020(+)
MAQRWDASSRFDTFVSLGMAPLNLDTSTVHHTTNIGQNLWMKKPSDVVLPVVYKPREGVSMDTTAQDTKGRGLERWSETRTGDNMAGIMGVLRMQVDPEACFWAPPRKGGQRSGASYGSDICSCYGTNSAGTGYVAEGVLSQLPRSHC